MTKKNVPKCTMDWAKTPPPDPTEEPEELRDMPALSRDHILSLEDKLITPMAVPEWGGKIYVRMISGHERDRFEGSLAGKKDSVRLKDFRARFFVLVVCDETGKPMFTKADVQALTQKSTKALERVLKMGLEINSMSDDDVKDLVKDSESDLIDDFGSD